MKTIYQEELNCGLHNQHVFDWKVYVQVVTPHIDKAGNFVGIRVQADPETERACTAWLQANMDAGSGIEIPISASYCGLDWEFSAWYRGYKALSLHDAHVRESGHRNRMQLLDMSFYHQIYAIPQIQPRS